MLPLVWLLLAMCWLPGARAAGVDDGAAAAALPAAGAVAVVLTAAEAIARRRTAKARARKRARTKQDAVRAASVSFASTAGANTLIFVYAVP